MSNIRNTALKLYRWGWAVIPVPHRRKFPSFKWGLYQQSPPSELDLIEWWPETTDDETGPGIGVICGGVSENLVALDFDSEAAYDLWATRNPDWAVALPTARSSRGFHVFFRTPQPLASTQFDIPGLTQAPGREGAPAGDLISEGKLVVLPPTLHPDGTPRVWITPPRSELRVLEPHRLGITLRQPLSRVAEELKPVGPVVIGDIVPGQRHDTLIRAAGRLHRGGLPQAAITAALHALNSERFKPPLPRHEVENAIRWTQTLAASHPQDLPELEAVLARAKGIGVETPSPLFTGFTGPLPPEERETSNPQSEIPQAIDPRRELLMAYPERIRWTEDGRAVVSGIILPAPDRDELARRAKQQAMPENLEEAFTACPEYLAEEEGEDGLRWLVEGFLPESFLVILGGTSKAGKSCFVTALCLAVAKGEPFLGLATGGMAATSPLDGVSSLAPAGRGPVNPVNRGEGEANDECRMTNEERSPMSNPAGLPVLWSCYEESRPERKLALREFGEDASTPNLYFCHTKPLINTEEGLSVLRHWIKKVGARLLVVDPLYGATDDESLTDGKTARNALQGLKDLCNETGCAAIVIHHFTKNVAAGLVRERLADSNQIAATASMDILMDSQDQPDGSRVLRLACRGRGTFANQTWIVASSSVRDYVLMGKGPGLQVDQVQREHVVLMLLKKVKDEALSQDQPIPELTAEVIAERTNMHLKTVQNLIKGFVKKGSVVLGEKRGKRLTYLSAA